MAFEVVMRTLNEDVLPGGSFLATYPPLREAADFDDGAGHSIESFGYGELSVAHGLSFSFDETGVTVTNNTLFTWAAYTTFWIELILASGLESTTVTAENVRDALATLSLGERVALDSIKPPPGYKFALIRADIPLQDGEQYLPSVVAQTDDYVKEDRGGGIQVEIPGAVVVGMETYDAGGGPDTATRYKTWTLPEFAADLTPELDVDVDLASETAAGIVELATNAEVATGSDTVRAVTPAGLHQKTASATAIGLVELATDAEVTTGADTARAVTPAGLHQKTASATAIGLVELATDAEVTTGSDTARAVTPAGLHQKTASDTARGLVELATDAETITGTATDRAITPANLQAKVASDTAKGLVELATDAETITGTDTARAVTPANLQAKVTSETVKGIVELATAAEVNTGTDTGRAIHPDGLAASYAGTKSVPISVVRSDTSTAVGDGTVGLMLGNDTAGMNLVAVSVGCTTQGVTGATDVQIRRQRGAASADMLSTKVTLGAEYVAADGVINASNDDVVLGDVLFVDIDAVMTTPCKGLYVVLEFRLP